MTIRGLHRLSLTGTAVLGTLGVMNGSSLLLGSGAVLLGVLVFASGRLLEVERPRSHYLIVHALTVATLVAASLVFRTARIDAVLIVVMLGIFNRFVLRAGQRDDLIILGAACVLLAATTTITPGLGFLAIVLLFVPCILFAAWASMMLGLTEVGGPDERRARVRSLGGRSVPRQRAAITVLGIAFMICGYALLSVFPRYNFGGLFSPGYFMSLPGASDSMELSNGGVSALDDSSVVMRIEPRSGELAAVDALYARLYVLDTFDGRRFSAGTDPVRFPLYPRWARYDGPVDAFTDDDGDSVVKVTIERLVPRNRPHPVATLGRARPSYAMLRHGEQSAAGGWLQNIRQNATLVAYKIDLDREADVAKLQSVAERRREARLLEVPSAVDPRVIELAERLTNGLGTAGEKIAAVLKHFDTGYTYSLEPLEGEAQDPLTRFLFEAKTGHCELYAGAVAVLLRASGVQARVATGYYGGWWNERGSWLELTEQDAHAWVEAYDDERGWRWVDATPATERARRRGKDLAWLRDMYDAIQGMWFDNVIDFDDNKRRRFLGAWEERFTAVGADLGEWWSDETTTGGSSSSGFAVFLSLAVVIPIAGVAGGMVWRKRRRSPDSLGRRLRRLLGEKDGENLPLGQLLPRAPETAASEARAAVQAYEAMRFGGARTASEVATSLEAFARALRTR